jgi:hypothetical protein
MNSILASATIRSVQHDGDPGDHVETVTMQMATQCQCQHCSSRDAVLFLGATLQLIEDAGLDYEAVLAQAIQMQAAGRVMH